MKDKERDNKLLKKALNESLTLVTNSSHLSIKRNKNIIKLHGTIRNKNSLYGFDGDVRKHYVIAREDYETYPLKHEAFTQLMRISLLQESYCLIGFSGVDTNFIEWIKWVRDILERGEKEKNNQEYKIYLIDIDANEITKDKLLFFENHRVYRVPIMKDYIIDFLETKTESSINDKKNPKQVIELFLHFLTGGSKFNSPKITFELLQQNKYIKLWEAINLIAPTKIDIKEVIQNADEILKLRQYNRLPSVHFAYSKNKQAFLFWTNHLLDKTKDSKSTRKLLSLVATAIRDTFLSIDFIWKSDDFNTIYNKAKKNPQIKREFDLFRLRQTVLELDSKGFSMISSKLLRDNNNNITYESILLLAFSFDFKKLKEKLNKWNSNSHWILKKAGLLALFEINEAKNLVLKHYNQSENEISQEQLYTLYLYKYIKQNEGYGFDKELHDKIQLYKNSGLKDINENLDSIINDINKKQEELKPYGDGRFTISNDVSFSNDFTKPQKGLQFIQVLIESGFPLSLPRVHLKSHELWYPIFMKIFEHYPYPTLFYSLQYSNKKFLKRIEQDFAYSETLKDYLNKILPLLLNSYLSNDTPFYYKQSILSFCSELFIAVDPCIWEKSFEKIWKMNNFIPIAFDKRYSVEYSFVKSAILYIQDIKIIQRIINTVIKYPESNISVEYLYHLAKNKVIKDEGEKLQTSVLSKKIENLIDNLSSNETALFVIYNLHSMLTNSQQEKAKKIIKKLNFDNIKNERIWSILLFYSISNHKRINNIKSAIIKNERLWDSGFTKNGLSIKNSYIEINRLRKTKDYPDGIIWSKSEVNKIYLKLKK